MTFFDRVRGFETGFWTLTMPYNIDQKVTCIEGNSHLAREPLHSLGWALQNRLLFGAIVLA